MKENLKQFYPILELINNANLSLFSYWADYLKTIFRLVEIYTEINGNKTVSLNGKNKFGWFFFLDYHKYIIKDSLSYWAFFVQKEDEIFCHNFCPQKSGF